VLTRIPEGEAATGPTEYTVRVSDRARRVRLVMTTGGELTVVVPRRFDRRGIPAIVEAKRPWIERTRAKMGARALSAAAAPALPERIVLPALGEAWQVEYRVQAAKAGASGRLTAIARQRRDGSLVVSGPSADEEAYRQALTEWLRRRARSTLGPRLEELARLHALSFERVSVRHQRTRWGSCSPRGAISLNLRLLFLEPALLDHVLVHELCHTRELNHSKRFWALLQVHDPEWVLHRRQTRDAWRSLPSWVDGEKAPSRL
jgi:predicted metal-dependent hydrolase